MAVKYLASRNDAEKPSAQGSKVPAPRGMIFSQKTVDDVERELHPQRVFVKQILRNIWLGFMCSVFLLCVSGLLVYVGAWDSLSREWQNMVAAKGSLTVTTDYVKSDVYLNGKLVGQTPLEMQSVAAGEYVVRVQAKDNVNNFFVPAEVPVTISGRNATIVKIVPAPTTETASYVVITSKDKDLAATDALLTILSDPAQVSVQVDGTEVGQGTPLRLVTLTEGTRKVTLRKDGYKDVSLEVAINPKKSVIVTAKMYQYMLKL